MANINRGTTDTYSRRQEEERSSDDDCVSALDAGMPKDIFRTENGDPIYFMLHKTLSRSRKKELTKRIEVCVARFLPSILFYCTMVLDVRRLGCDDRGQGGHYYR
jgi:hypothetical protein